MLYVVSHCIATEGNIRRARGCHRKTAPAKPDREERAEIERERRSRERRDPTERREEIERERRDRQRERERERDEKQTEI